MKKIFKTSSKNSQNFILKINKILKKLKNEMKYKSYESDKHF